jgi:hypothetical protein
MVRLRPSLRDADLAPVSGEGGIARYRLPNRRFGLPARFHDRTFSIDSDKSIASLAPKRNRRSQAPVSSERLRSVAPTAAA